MGNCCASGSTESRDAPNVHKQQIIDLFNSIPNGISYHNVPNLDLFLRNKTSGRSALQPVGKAPGSKRNVQNYLEEQIKSMNC